MRSSAEIDNASPRGCNKSDVRIDALCLGSWYYRHKLFFKLFYQCTPLSVRLAGSLLGLSLSRRIDKRASPIGYCCLRYDRV